MSITKMDVGCDGITIVDTCSSDIHDLKSLRLANLKRAELLVEEELTALDILNRRKAIADVATYLQICPGELDYFLEHGEEEAERIFNLSRGTPDAVPGPPPPVTFAECVKKPTLRRTKGNVI